jgi:hypothetical protein
LLPKTKLLSFSSNSKKMDELPREGAIGHLNLTKPNIKLNLG